MNGVTTAAQRIRERCAEIGLSLEELGRLVGLRAGGIVPIANGRVRPRLTTALRMARILEVEVEHLFTER